MYNKDPNNWKACTFHPKCINNSPLINTWSSCGLEFFVMVDFNLDFCFGLPELISDSYPVGTALTLVIPMTR
ncbi:hypothetical protein HanRHA438_Chr09g0402041 [Helianthus annuus]|nr:hypothetical protein HanIR_Chr09g0421101 [Helianthus annuus]KAJ0888439.1 hypothetical protein HanRHA438_Chr09g0402041 [Helianthus annuus]